MTRFGVSMDENLLEKFDKLIHQKGYTNRSEAIRDLIRKEIVEQEWESDETEVVGTLTIVYNHETRELSDKLTALQHEWHHNVISTMHVHIDQHNCLEVTVVRGKANLIRSLAEKIISVRGVKHGKLTMTSTGKQL